MSEPGSNTTSSSIGDRDIEIWKLKRLIKNLENAHGNGTSILSILIPPTVQIDTMMSILFTEFRAATNIRSRLNRKYVLSAISSVKQRLKAYNQVPPNGLVVYCGFVVTIQGNYKLVNVEFEPYRKVESFIYLCDNKFHTEHLTALLSTNEKVGFIVLDANSVLFGSLEGNVPEVLYKCSANLPSKHSRGSQSLMRFSRQGKEKRHNYIRKVARKAVELFISHDELNVASIILAGSGELKHKLYQSDMLDGRLRAKIIKLVEVSYGAERGFTCAIDEAAELLNNHSYIKQKKILNNFLSHMAQDTSKVCFGVRDTLNLLEQGEIKTLICWENLSIIRYVIKSHIGGNAEIISHVTAEQDADNTYLRSRGVQLDQVEKQLLMDWIVNTYKKYCNNLVIITDRMNEGNQFVHGFGGIGGVLQHSIEQPEIKEEEVDTQYDVSEY